MLANEELILVRGGGITSTMLNSLSRFMETLFNFGQSVGSSLRRMISKKTCKLS